MNLSGKLSKQKKKRKKKKSEPRIAICTCMGLEHFIVFVLINIFIFGCILSIGIIGRIGVMGVASVASMFCRTLKLD